MRFLAPGEARYLRRHLGTVRHITLDPRGPGVLRLHLIPCRYHVHSVPFTAVLNGQYILPLETSWAILLCCLMEAAQPLAGQQLGQAQWAQIRAQACRQACEVYRGTPPAQVEGDLDVLLRSLEAIAQGAPPPVQVGAVELGNYAPRMLAPHRMDLMISSMVRDGGWHCNQKCLHCYAAGQPLAQTPELETDQWLAVLEKCRAAGIPQVTFTGGEPTLRHDLVQLVQAAQWFVTRLNTNGRLLTSALCRDLYEASLDAVQVTLYAARADIHDRLVGAPGFRQTVEGIRHALDAGLNVSVNTPLCSLNADYADTVRFVHGLGVRYLTCSGLIPAGGASHPASTATRLSPQALAAALRPAMEYAAREGVEISFTSPGWLPDGTLRSLGFTELPSCGACLSNMAIAPNGTVLPCQSWLSGPGLGDMLHTPWPRIWNSAECRRIRAQSARMEHLCPLGATPMREGC